MNCLSLVRLPVSNVTRTYVRYAIYANHHSYYRETYNDPEKTALGDTHVQSGFFRVSFIANAALDTHAYSHTHTHAHTYTHARTHIALGIMDSQAPLPMFSFMEEEDKPKKRLADPITTPRRGPLVLSKFAGRDEQQTVGHRTAKLQQQHLPKQKWLNRFPVPNVQRPIDAIETNLGRLSFAELKQQAITVSLHSYGI